MSTIASQPDRGVSPDGVPDRAVVLGVAAVALAILVVTGHFVFAQLGHVRANIGDWGHTLLVPIASGWMLWIQRARLRSTIGRPSWSGLAIVFVGLALYAISLLGIGILRAHNARAIGVAAVIVGASATVFSWRSFATWWFPIAYLVVFGQYLTNATLAPVTERLQDVATAGARFMLDLIGFEATRSGNLIVLDLGDRECPLDVAEACSGMRMLMAFLALGTIAAWVGLARWWQRIVLIGLAIPVAIGVNICRITMQGWLDTIDGDWTVGQAHSLLGMIWLLPAIGIFAFLRWVIEPLAGDDARRPLDVFHEENAASDAAGGTWTVTPALRRAWLVLLAMLVVGAGVLHVAAAGAGVRTSARSAPLRAPFATIPTTLESWRRVGADAQFDDAVLDVLGTRTYLDRVYESRDAGDRTRLQLHLAYYTGGSDARAHVPERCFAVHGLIEQNAPIGVPIDLRDGGGDLLRRWTPGDRTHSVTGEPFAVALVEDLVRDRVVAVEIPVGPIAIRTTVFRDPTRPQRRIVAGYLFIANGRFTDSARSARMISYDWRAPFASFCKVQCVLDEPDWSGGDEQLLERWKASVESLLRDAMPEIARCLPTWPDPNDHADAGVTGESGAD